MKGIEKYLDETVKIISNQNVYEVILFGSISKGVFQEDSDIDLLIILDIDRIPKSYEEKMELKLNIRKSVRHINKKVPLDLLIYTKKEYEIIKKEQSSFYLDIVRTGKVLYEKAS